MANKHSKSDTPVKPVEKRTNNLFRQQFRTAYTNSRDKVHARKSSRVRLHRSFKRSYREDYAREFEAPGLIQHAAESFKMIFRHWRTFLPFILLATIFNIVLVGLMSEETYVTFQETLDETSAEVGTVDIGNFAKAGLLLISTVTTGGLNQGMSEVQQLFAIIIFIIVWLVTIFLVRHYLAGHKPKLRDGLYNALTPLISTLCVLVVVFIELIPLFIVIITYSAAVTTDFLATPFYALVYFIFAAAMLLLSGYLVSSSLIALVAVTAPGLYPLTALRTASDLMAGRRIKFIIRLIYLIFVLAVVWVVVMLPIMLIDLWLKGCFDWLAGLPIVSFFMLLLTCFSFVYISTYVYLYYRRMLDHEDQ